MFVWMLSRQAARYRGTLISPTKGSGIKKPITFNCSTDYILFIFRNLARRIFSNASSLVTKHVKVQEGHVMAHLFMPLFASNSV